MRAAQIKNGVVVNYAEVELFDSDFIDPLDSVIGSRWDGVSFTPPPQKAPTIPDRIPRLNARLALLNIGKWDMVQPAIDSLPEEQRPIAQAYFEDAQYWNRQDQFVLMIAQLIGMTPLDIDSAFIYADSLG